MPRQLGGMPLQLGEVVEGVDAAQFASVNQAHEQVADTSPILGLVEQRVLAVQNRFLQGSFANVVVQRCPRLPQKQRKPLPVLEQIPDRQSQTGVRFHFPFRELSGEPNLQLVHHRTAMKLVEAQPLFRHHALLPRPLGVLGGAVEFLPAVGWIASAAAILTIGFLTHSHWIWMAVLIVVWRLVQDYLNSPLIMGDNLKLQPLTVVFALMVGGQVGGIAGLYLSVPAVAVLRIVWLEYLSNRNPVTSFSDRPLMQVKV